MSKRQDFQRVLQRRSTYHLIALKFHSTLEDTQTTYEELVTNFGLEVSTGSSPLQD